MLQKKVYLSHIQKQKKCCDVGNELDKLSSNLEQGCLHFTLCYFYIIDRWNLLLICRVEFESVLTINNVENIVKSSIWVIDGDLG